MPGPALKQAKHVRVTGVVQGVGFRPHVYRLAHQFGISGWVLNAESGVEIHAESDPETLDEFVRAIAQRPPPAARIASIETSNADVQGFADFEIHFSERGSAPTVRVSPDLPVCDACVRELFDPQNRRYRYPYINCTDCGPRYSIVRGLPYDRAQTTMRDWPMCAQCRREYDDPADRRFHAQPVACPACGPNVFVEIDGAVLRGNDAIERVARLLREGGIAGIKGLGGYHLACHAQNASAVATLRARKYRKERPFALMVRDAFSAEQLVHLSVDARALLQSAAHPIVIAPAKLELSGIAPDNDDLGVMLPYTPLQYLLFAAGAPDVLVMTSANRSSEPIAYRDGDARDSLAGIADALLVGEREIARRMDDSVVREGTCATTVLRHARGYAPQAAATLPALQPIVAVGADLKNAVAVVVHGQAFVSQHVGDLDHYDAFESFKETIADLRALYELPEDGLLLAHDAHPEYASTAYAQELSGEKIAVQHHRAHIASVLAERGALESHVLGFAFDGTGYGEDGAIWGCEVFRGDLANGLQRVAHLRPARLPGGDAAARFPVQAAAGFLETLDVPEMRAAPFCFPQRYDEARELLRTNVRTFDTTSAGRLFDTVAALLGFTRPITFEAQAAMWVEHLARGGTRVRAYPFPFENGELDYRPLLDAIVRDRVAGCPVEDIARAFHEAVLCAIRAVYGFFEEERIVFSGGVFQNGFLVDRLCEELGARAWMNRIVPPNDGGICLGQAAVASLRT